MIPLETEKLSFAPVRSTRVPLTEVSAFSMRSIWHEMKLSLFSTLYWISDARSTFRGYDQIPVHPATRFIATMNYGYAGTRELNELSPPGLWSFRCLPSRRTSDPVTAAGIPGIKSSSQNNFRSFSDIEKKCESGETDWKSPWPAWTAGCSAAYPEWTLPLSCTGYGLTNKTFDAYEQTLIRDIITTRISKKTEVPRSSPNRSRTKSTGRKQNLIFQIVKPAPGKESNHMKYNKNKEFSEIKKNPSQGKRISAVDEPKYGVDRSRCLWFWTTVSLLLAGWNSWFLYKFHYWLRP